MMKKLNGTIPALLLGLAILAACNNGLEPAEIKGETGTGTASIVIDGASAAARTLAPSSSSFTRYEATFSGGTHNPVVLNGLNPSINLVPGTWTITVTAYTGTAAPYTAVGRGSATVTVVAGQTVTADVTIKPITNEGGKGSLAYSITFPAADTASLKLTNLATNAQYSVDLTSTTSGVLSNLDPGYYLLRISLTKGTKSAGTSEVVHIYKGLTTNATYTFTDDDFGKPVTGVGLDKTSATIAVNGSTTLTATVDPANATNKNITWSTSNSSIAAVSSTSGTGGVAITVTGKAAGNATITATTVDGGIKASCTVTVTVPVNGISLDKTLIHISEGGTEYLTATVTPNNATNKNITWSITNPSVATVYPSTSTSGNSITVYGIAAGTAFITATTQDGTYSEDCYVMVSVPTVPVTGISLDKTSAGIAVNGSTTLTATIDPANATNKNITWSTSNSSIAAVSSTSSTSGNSITVTGIAAGNATITATTVDGGIKASCTVTVTGASSSFTQVLKEVYFSTAVGSAHLSGSLSGNTINFSLAASVKNQQLIFFYIQKDGEPLLRLYKEDIQGGATVVKWNNIYPILQITGNFQATITRNNGDRVTYYVNITWK
jgi:uncharacterized protein YjdB